MLTDIYILRMVIGCLAAAFGIPGNITIIVVFTRQGIKNATDITFIALGVVDLVASFINGMKIVMVFYHNEDPWACFIEVIAARSALYAGLFLTIWIAFYRYQAVCKPFDRRIGRRAAVLISIVCTLIAFVLHIPFFFITTSIKLRGEYYGCSVYGNIPWGRDVYAKTQAIVFCISALVITVLYLRIYKVIRAHQSIRRQMTTGSTFASQARARNLKDEVSSTDSIPTVSASVSISVDTLSTTTKPVGTCTQKAQQPNDNFGTSRQKAQPPNHEPKPSSKKPRNHSSDHKTTRVVIIITVIFFLLWLPNIVIDQIPSDHITRIIQETHIMIYFFYQIKYISHITNVFVYLFTYRRFRQSCCRPFNQH